MWALFGYSGTILVHSTPNFFQEALFILLSGLGEGLVFHPKFPLHCWVGKRISFFPSGVNRETRLWQQSCSSRGRNCLPGAAVLSQEAEATGLAGPLHLKQPSKHSVRVAISFETKSVLMDMLPLGQVRSK